MCSNVSKSLDDSNPASQAGIFNAPRTLNHLDNGDNRGPEVYLVERFICNEEAGGSTPPGSTALAEFYEA